MKEHCGFCFFGFSHTRAFFWCTESWVYDGALAETAEEATQLISSTEAMAVEVIMAVVEILATEVGKVKTPNPAIERSAQQQRRCLSSSLCSSAPPHFRRHASR